MSMESSDLLGTPSVTNERWAVTIELISAFRVRQLRHQRNFPEEATSP